MRTLSELVKDALSKGETQAYKIAARIRRENTSSVTEFQVSSALQVLRKSGICRWDGGRWELVSGTTSVKPIEDAR
jgi:hypothetical protein